MENGEGGEDGTFMETKMASLSLSDANNIDSNNNSDGLFQVIKAVEAAEATIKQQVEENNWLRAELEEKMQQLNKYKSDYSRGNSPHPLDNDAYEPPRHMESENQMVRTSTPDNIHEHQFSHSIVPKENMMQTDEYHEVQEHGRTTSLSNRASSPLRILPGGPAAPDFTSSQLLAPLAESLTPIGYRVDGQSDRQISVSLAGIVPISEGNSKSLKQELGLKIQEHEEELTMLKKHLAEYSVNEAKILNEKHNLEKRISHMRMAFDQQQQDLVDAASRAISYRQDIIEENIRLAYALQAAQQERSTFVSSLMPLLAEYSLDPPAADAQSVVSNVKVLFRHLHEKLMFTEAKLKESQYQISPYHLDRTSSSVAQSHYFGANDSLIELVPQPQYHDGNQPASQVPRATTDWDLLEHREGDYGIGLVRTSEPDVSGKYSSPPNRNTTTQAVPVHRNVNREEFHVASRQEETTSKRVTFGNLVSNSRVEDSDMERHQNDNEPSANWAPKNSQYTTAEEPSSSYPAYLPVVPEEHSSSVSEDDGPLPAIEGLQISGEALPGRELQASGYSINGTTSCNFEWVRHMEDGSFNYIEGAKQPHYLITADDVDTFLAIEVQPLDNRKRKGELVTVFANDHNKIVCDLEMQNCIKRAYDYGQASYSVSMAIGFIDMWEPATLSIKKNSYSIKSNGSSGVVVSEKYSESIIVSIPFGSLMEFSVMDSRGGERLLRAESTETNSCRDTIVLTLRLFILRANARKKTKKRGLYFGRDWMHFPVN